MTIDLLDGATGVELRRRGARVPSYDSSIWSAAALLHDPETVVDVHESYIEAGADIITANNYAVTPVLLAREGLEGETEALSARACLLADQARRRSGRAVRIAASLPPIDTTYRSDLVKPFDELLPIYRRLAGALAPHADLLICETLTTAEEARAAALAGLETGLPTWVSWTVDSAGLLRGGETIAAAHAAIADLPVGALLVNCATTASIEEALPALAATGMRFGAYANDVRKPASQAELDAGHYDPLSPEAYAGEADIWLKAGATIIGGCCGTGPDHVRAMRRLIDSRAGA